MAIRVLMTAVLAGAMMLAPAALAAPQVAGPPVEGAMSRADQIFEEGFAYFNGSDGKPKDPVKARPFFERAAAQGHAPSMNALAILYENGLGVSPDPAKAREWLEKAAAAGDDAARLNLGIRLARSDAKADHRRSVELLTAVHESKSKGSGPLTAIAGGELAKAYLFGDGVARDVPRGVKLLKAADAAGSNDAGQLFLLGRTYESGWGGERPDSARSLGYFRRAAERGSARAAWYVGMAHLRGEDAPKDDKAAWTWVKRAADGGDVRGQISAAVMLATGEGVAEDDAAARDWYRKAAEQGSAHALRGLSGMLLSGEGGEVEWDRGVAYLQLAAEAGDEPAETAVKVNSQLIARAQAARVEALKAEWVRRYGQPMKDD